MAADLSNEAWTQIRYDYEHTERTIEDICAEHGISTGTLRDRRHRWGWKLRRPPVPREGPPPMSPPPLPARPLAPAPWPDAAPPPAPCLPAASPPAAAEAAAPPDAPADDGAIVPRLQSAVTRVLPAIEATVARLAAGPAHPREMEQAGRALASLTRTLRELNGLLAQHQLSAADGWDDDMPEDIDEFRLELARRIEAFVQSRMGEEDAGAAPADAGAAAPASDAQAASGPESASAPKSVSAPSP